ncbi:hypothetical protein LOTGIDRAFT_227977 [Lottia gigantea]|uniref:Choice-of-anchor I domain-containing protein n=1 Tax=Lottia gigantea TaxID=225164 RepID=V4BCI4_LOTGI|nr:hypothetical protein LOTGIDRAFT_227977 [Lottia gigantea]ESP05351.1 hypothetical protein LOTGIDRAFT_227977 [Lottia gigantea]
MAKWYLMVLLLLPICRADIVLKEEGYLKLPNRDGAQEIDSGTATESAYDSNSRFLYVVGKFSRVLHVIDVANVASPAVLQTFTFDTGTDGYPLDIQVCRNQAENRAYVAIAFGEQDPSKQGHVILYSPYIRGETALKPINAPDERITVGIDPDNIKFTSDCNKLVVSNEGVASVISGEFIDPPGTINIVTIPLTGNPGVKTIEFTYIDDPAETDRLLALGVRYMVRTNPVQPGVQNPFSNNIEPEYIAVSPNNAYAYITLQENNAIAKVDLIDDNPATIFPMGWKDFQFSTLDLSDRDASPNVHMKRRRVRGLYQPDKISFLEWGNKLYLLTADEGKPFNLPGASFADNARARDLENEYSFPWDTNNQFLASVLDDTQLGRAIVSLQDGRVGQQITEIYTFGGRGFSIFDSNTLTREWESGDMIEKFSRWFYPDVFNSGYTVPNFTPIDERDTQSPFGGPSINSLAIGTFKGRTVLFFGSGQNGQIYTFQLQASVTERVEPEFQSVHRRGQIDGTWTNLYSRGVMGDIGISDLIVVPEAESNVAGTPILIALSERSGSVSIYTLIDQQFPLNVCSSPPSPFKSMNHHNRTRPLF